MVKVTSLLFIVMMIMMANTTVAQEQMSEYEKMMAERNKVDWPFLKRYQDENAKLPAPVANENRVVFMGNSITEGWKDFRPSFFAGRPYLDRGISGQTTPQMLIRFRQDVIDLKPKVVVILAGINDIAGNTGPATQEMITDNLISMTELAKANGIKVILSAVLPAWDFPWNPGSYPSERIVNLNKWIKEYAATNGLLYADYYTAMVDDKMALKAEYTYDGVHPNEAGYQIMEPIVEAEIAKALK